MDRSEINRKAREAYHRRTTENPERVREQNRIRTKANRERNPETVRRSRLQHYQKNREAVLRKNAEYAERNREAVRDAAALRAKRRRKDDLSFKIAGNLRARLGRAMRGETKLASAVKDLGCTVEQLREHLESLFQPGMGWHNYGRTGWHIDHVRPLSAFDLSVKEQALAACHFTNLQPLWWRDNLQKGGERQARQGRTSSP